MIKFHDMEQQTDEWFELRERRPLTASNGTAISANGKGLDTLILKKLSERFSTSERENFSNKHTDRGNEFEPLARAEYEMEMMVTVREVGFVANDKYELAGASPDGLIGDKGGVEIKCFDDPKHFLNIFDFKIESGYMWQMQMQMLICELEWVDYVLYNPNFEQSLLIQRVFPDPAKQLKLKIGLKAGAEKYKKMLEEYQNIS